MNKTTIADLARFKKVPVQLPLPEKKRRAPQNTQIDPDGLQVMDDLVSTLGSITEAAKALSIDNANFGQWRRGTPIRKCYTDLARFIMADHKKKNAPKIVLTPHQHTAVITLHNDHREAFEEAVIGAGGQYTILTYPTKQGE